MRAPPLYRGVLGLAWNRLPEPIRSLHTVTSSASFVGRCDVERGRNPLGRTLASLVGFPSAGSNQPIVVRLDATPDGERWTRTIGGRTFVSHQSAGSGRSAGLVRERFGPVAIDMALAADETGLRYTVSRWTCFSIPLPLSLGPRTSASEIVADGAFVFDVAISHPWIGLIVHYRGALTPADR